jgi:hypothetical protein
VPPGQAARLPRVLHLRLISPPERTGAVQDLLLSTPGVTHVIVLPGAAQVPPGDVVLCDVAREATDDLVSSLRDIGLEDAESISIDDIDTVLS